MNKIVLVPEPKIITPSKGCYRLKEADKQSLHGYTLNMSLPACIEAVFVSEPESDAGLDWYRLDIIESRITVTASGDCGVYYAVQTLRQLASGAEDGMINCCTIEDRADFPVRGVMLDVSRDRVPTMETVYDLIDRISSWKYNQFQLYTEHTFAYSKHEQVWRNASPFTADEIMEISAYCAARCIELVPNQNSFGHMERWLKHDDYKYLAESPDGFYDPWDVFREHSSTLAPAVPETLDFLGCLYDELLPCFNSDFLNVGGDEPYELGKGRSKELCDEKGLDRVYMDYLLKLRALAAARGKRIQIYGDIIMKYPHLIKDLPDDLILVNWGYEAEHPFESECEKIASSGIPFYICTGASSWNSISGRWSNTKRNIENGAVNGLRYGAEGFMVSEWGDNGHHQQYTAVLPGLLYGAAAAWNTAALSRFDLEQSLKRIVFNDGYLAEASMKLQDVWQCSKITLHNVSLPAVVMLDPLYPYYREDFKKFRGYDFSAELILIDEAEKLLLKAPSSLMRDELCLTADLLRHGCNLGRLQFGTDSLTIDEISEQDRLMLASEIGPLMEEYIRLWNKRSRPGGLQDSLSRFKVLKDLYIK